MSRSVVVAAVRAAEVAAEFERPLRVPAENVFQAKDVLGLHDRPRVSIHQVLAQVPERLLADGHVIQANPSGLRGRGR